MDMEILYTTIAILTSLFFLHKIISLSKSKYKKKNHLPPSPPSLPLLGHLHLLKHPFHRTLHSLAQTHGPIFSLQLGRQPTIVVSSSWAAEQCFTQNDVVFANRPNLLAAHHLGYNNTLLLWAPYGPHWRNLRRVATITTLSQKQIALAGPGRRVEVVSMIRDLIRGSENGTRAVNLNEVFSKVGRNLVMRVMNGRPWEAKVMEPPPSLMTVCDFIPVLRWVGYKGIEREMIRLKKERDEILQRLIDESRAFRRTVGVRSKTVIEELLDLQEEEPQYYTDEILKGLIMVLLLAGSDTSARTLEWAMALLLTHPKVMSKAKAEIDTHIGEGRLVEDSDLPKLPYISCIISETLRLYPPVPLLIPHYSSEDCTVGDYHIPQGTLLLVNAWAIQRDPEVWERAAEFEPERFEKEKLDGLNFKYLPFGMGRRACPGTNFALRNVNLVLANLIRCFDWEASEVVDMNEKVVSSIVVPMENSVHAICHPRASMQPLLSQI